jgi:hypothetical protein
LTASRAAATITGRVTGVPQLDSPAESAPGTTSMRRGHHNADGSESVAIELSPAGDDLMWWSGGTGGAPNTGLRCLTMCRAVIAFKRAFTPRIRCTSLRS